MSDSIVTSWTVACQAPLSMEFSRKEHWSGLPFPPTGDLPDPGINPVSPPYVCKALLNIHKTAKTDQKSSKTFRSVDGSLHR